MRLLRRLWARWSLTSRTVVPEVLGLERFRALLMRERNRADRVSSQLSLIVLDLSSASVRTNRLAELFISIQARIRDTDSVGWFDRRSIGILLPETGSAGAMVLAKELRTKLPQVPQGTSWRIYTYPEDQVPPDPRRDGELRLSQQNGHRNGTAAKPAGTSTKGTHERHSGSRSPVSPEMSARRATPEGHDVQIEGIEVAPLRSALLVPRSLTTRLLDIVVASVALLFLGPVILVAGIAVKLTSKGPMFFPQRRLSQWGRPFTIYKLRSMRANAEADKQHVLELNEQEGPVYKSSKDPRITRVGRFIRRTSIDELPQLWNVLRGDMSLVGPRPPIPEEVEQYEAWQLRRLETRAGLTCIWQVSGRSEILFKDWVRLDIRYGQRKNFWFDLRILSRTLPAVLSGKGAN